MTFDDCYKKYFPGLVYFANKYIHDQEASTDVVQDVFIAFNKKFNFENQGESTIKSWLYTSVKNKCSHYTSGLKNRNTREKDFAYRRGDTEDCAINYMIETELVSNLYKLINELPLATKEIIILHFYGDMSYKEIAFITKKNKSTIKNLIQVGLSKLRDHFSYTKEEFYAAEEKKILNIFRSEVSAKTLAARYGMETTSIYNIKTGKSNNSITHAHKI